MKRIELGSTGLVVSKLGFGGIPIQRVDEDQAIETVKYAVEKGVDYIDTARVYTTSEYRIGMALQQTKRKVVLATKSFNRTSDGIQEDVAISLKELQRNYIDLYQCHSVNDGQTYHQIVSPGGALEGLKKAKQAGWIGHIGISSHSLDLLDRVLDDGLFETVMVCFSFLEPAAQEKIIPKAIQKGIGVIAMKPFSGGVLDNAKLALKFVLSQPGILVLPGVERKELVNDNWKIFKRNPILSEKEWREIESIRRTHHKSFCRRCGYCQPCPQEIPIPYVLNFRGIAKTSGLDPFRGGSFREALVKAEQCSECRECTTRCPYGLPVPELIQDTLRWLKPQLE
jgi:predicted aldo/keto reductase-like oxidoreductase